MQVGGLAKSAVYYCGQWQTAVMKFLEFGNNIVIYSIVRVTTPNYFYTSTYSIWQRASCFQVVCLAIHPSVRPLSINACSTRRNLCMSWRDSLKLGASGHCVNEWPLLKRFSRSERDQENFLQHNISVLKEEFQWNLAQIVIRALL